MKPLSWLSVLLMTIATSGCVTTGSNTLSGLLASSSSNPSLKDLSNNLSDSPYKNIISGTLGATTQWTPEQERQIGQDMAAQLLGAQPLLRNNFAQKYVNLVGLWIAMQTDQAQRPWRFGIIDTPSLNAFAAPGGYIFITRGLFLRLRDEAELAGVLAHEIGHVLQRHHVKAIQKQGFGKAVLGVLEAKTNVGKNPAISNLAKNLYASGLDKGDEYEADRIGVVLAARAGYSAFGLPSVLQMYAASAQDASLELLFATHPAPIDRLDRLDTLMTRQFDNLNRGVSQTSRLAKVQDMVRYANAPRKPNK